MSSDLRSDRAFSNDPFGKFLNKLARMFNASQAKDAAELVDNPEDIYGDGQDVDSALMYHSFALTKKHTLNVDYQSASEPDVDKVKIMLSPILPNLGDQLQDDSEFDNHANIIGEPTLVDGNFDLGVFDGVNNVKSLAVRFNRPTSEFVNQECMSIPDNTGIRIIGDATGFSIFIRFRLLDLAQQGSADRRIFEKIDDSTPNNGIILRVSTAGALKLNIKRSGTEFNNDTATGVIATNTVYEVWITFTVSGTVTHIYVNNVDKTLSAGTSPSWHSPLTDLNFAVFNRGGTTTSGFVYGDFYTMVVFKGKVVSPTEISNHFTNKITLADIPFGQVAVGSLGASN